MLVIESIYMQAQRVRKIRFAVRGRSTTGCNKDCGFIENSLTSLMWTAAENQTPTVYQSYN